MCFTLSMQTYFTVKETKDLRRRHAIMIGGRESFPNSGHFLDPLGKRLEFPDPSIMYYVEYHHSSSAPLSKEDLQRFIQDAKIFFTQREIEGLAISMIIYKKKHELKQETEFDSYMLKAVARRLAKLQSEAKASRSADAADAADAAEAS